MQVIAFNPMTRGHWYVGVFSLVAWLSGPVAWCDEVDKHIGELKDKSAEVRQAAAKALGELKDARAAAPLAAALYNQPSVKAAVQEALVSLGVPSVEPLVRIMKGGGDEGWDAARLLVRIGQPGEPAVTSVVEVLVHSDFTGHPLAEYTLTTIGAPAVGPLVAALRDATQHNASSPHEAGHVWKVARVLGRIGTPVVPPMIAALKDDNPGMREAATVVLGQVKDTRAIGPVLTAFKDNDQRVRSAALDTMGKMGAPAVEPLVATLKDSDPDVRQRAAEALVRIGAPAVAPLSAALKDTDPAVRKAAAWVLDALRQQGNGSTPSDSAASVTGGAKSNSDVAAHESIENKPIMADMLVAKAEALCLLHLKSQYRFYLVNASLLNRSGKEVKDIRANFVVGKQSDIAMMYWASEVSILVRVGETEELDSFEKTMGIPSAYIARVSIERLAQLPDRKYWGPVSHPPQK